jgi:hypothetical protein
MQLQPLLSSKVWLMLFCVSKIVSLKSSGPGR